MSRESVWAYVLALQVKSGDKLPDESALLTSLKEMSNHYHTFDSRTALKQLDNLKVISPDVMTASLKRLVSEDHAYVD